MKLTMMRHGQTNRNALNRVLGRSDLPLNQTGLLQADEAGKKLADTRFDAIYSSPMQRTLQTAEGVIRHQKQAVPLYPAEALIEQNFGIFEGSDRDDPVYQKEKRLYFKPFEGGESMLDVAARVYQFLDRLAADAEQKGYEHILLVTHGGVCRLIENYFDGMDNETFTTFFMKNCETRTFTLPDPKRDALQPLDEEELSALEKRTPALRQERSETFDPESAGRL